VYRLIAKDFELIWEALHDYRDKVIPEGDPVNDHKWSEICTVMQWVQEDLELDY
jgi:hypothetical protein